MRRPCRAWRAGGALALAGALLAALSVRVPAGEGEGEREHFPRATPHALAHLLADFSQQPNVGSWSVVEDANNYTTWRYTVAFECGARCTGRAAVSAHAAPRHAAPQHGVAALHHRVAVRLHTCAAALPLLPWPALCDETDTVAVVRGGVPGAELTTWWRARCGVLRALSGACAADLRTHRRALLARVRAALAGQ